MHVSELEISNIRSISRFVLKLSDDERVGWHVLLGANGAGKSSVVRSLAVVLTGPTNATGLNQVWRDWQRQGGEPAKISAKVAVDPADDSFTGSGKTSKSFTASVGLESRDGSAQYDLVSREGKSSTANRSIWSNSEGRGWFAASFGPFRRFTGGDMVYDRLFLASPRLAGHLSAFNEAVALTEGLRWLSSLRVSSLENEEEKSSLLDALIHFINSTRLLPGNACIEEVRSNQVLIKDGNGAVIPTDLLSDGYRSILSMMFELIRQLAIAFGMPRLIRALQSDDGALNFSGVVAIDEVDAHLHPDWQSQIGAWFTRVFPRMQFIVTTHSPIICRNARSIWWLPRPGTQDQPRRLEGQEYDRLINGSILDAFGTNLFGQGVSRSPESHELLDQLARLNRKALKGPLSDEEGRRLVELRAVLPSTAAIVEG